jgi:hypothetical protein
VESERHSRSWTINSTPTINSIVVIQPGWDGVLNSDDNVAWVTAVGTGDALPRQNLMKICLVALQPLVSTHQPVLLSWSRCDVHFGTDGSVKYTTSRSIKRR